MVKCVTGGMPCKSCQLTGVCLALEDAAAFNTPTNTMKITSHDKAKALIELLQGALNDALRIAELNSVWIEDDIQEWDGYLDLKCVLTPLDEGGLCVKSLTTKLLWDCKEADKGRKRYEKLRRLNVAEFSDLFNRNLAGERFDDMVDSLPE